MKGALTMNTQTVVLAGTAPTFAAVDSTEEAEIGAVLIVKNASVSPVTVTLGTPGTLATGDAYPDKAYTVAASGERWIPLLRAYADPTIGGRANVTFSATASVTAAVVRLP